MSVGVLVDANDPFFRDRITSSGTNAVQHAFKVTLLHFGQRVTAMRVIVGADRLEEISDVRPPTIWGLASTVERREKRI